MNQNVEYKNSDWSTKTILIVEDNYANYFLICELLKEYKINIIWAKSGEEAINYCQNKIQLDLILMDYILPGINGDETIKRLLKIDSKYKILGISSNNYEKEFKESGAIDYISNPIILEILEQKILNQLF